jgi:hypothetical protein
MQPRTETQNGERDLWARAEVCRARLPPGDLRRRGQIMFVVRALQPSRFNVKPLANVAAVCASQLFASIKIVFACR